MAIRFVRQHLLHICRMFPSIFPATADHMLSTAFPESLGTTHGTSVFQTHSSWLRRYKVNMRVAGAAPNRAYP